MQFLVMIPWITALWFAAIYPLFIWINRGRSVCASYYQFHTLFPCIILLLALMLGLHMDVQPRWPFVLWAIASLGVVGSVWGKDAVNPWIVSLPSLAGLPLCLFIYQTMGTWTLLQQVVLVLSAVILCGVTYAGVLGHWYLNVPGLPLRYLSRATGLFVVAIGFRLVLDVVLWFQQRVLYRGDWLSLTEFVRSFEGMLLALAIFFVSALPLCLGLMTLHIIRLKNTQAATGILYVVVASLLMGDFFSKYYVLAYRVVL